MELHHKRLHFRDDGDDDGGLRVYCDVFLFRDARELSETLQQL